MLKALHRRRLACLLLFTAACVPVATMAAEPSSTTLDAPESVILLIGDGMGPQQVGLLLDWADAAGAGPTMLERFMKSATMGLLRTPMADSLLTDSAASATALACGVSTRLGAVGVDEAGNPVETCLEAARSAGRRTGLVTTTRVTHATPACFAAHLRSRNNEGQIARQMLAAGVDLLLGGGARFFLGGAGPGAQDLGEEIQAQGTRVVTTLAELDALTAAGGPILGLFAPSDIPYAIDRDEEGEADAPGLGAMIREAIKLLDGGGKGFFLMVEGGRIDHGCHANDAAATLGEMREFDEAVGIALEYRKLHPRTLVIVTADHETGGLAVTGTLGNWLRDEDLLALSSTRRSIEAGAPPPEERGSLEPAVFGLGRAAFYPRYSHWVTSRALERSAGSKVSFATQGHTTTPVLILAEGPGAERFQGLHLNRDVGKALREWMVLPVPERRATR